MVGCDRLKMKTPMQRSQLFRLTVFIGLLTSCTLTALANKPSFQSANRMTTAHNPSIQTVKLLARDESQNRKTGRISNDDNRPIGFADLFLELSNTEASVVTLRIQRIDIQDEQTGSVLITTPTVQEIILQPLERGEYDVHLTNQAGYVDHRTVKAIVNYQAGDRLHTVESSSVTVQRY